MCFRHQTTPHSTLVRIRRWTCKIRNFTKWSRALHSPHSCGHRGELARSSTLSRVRVHRHQRSLMFNSHLLFIVQFSYRAVWPSQQGKDPTHHQQSQAHPHAKVECESHELPWQQHSTPQTLHRHQRAIDPFNLFFIIQVFTLIPRDYSYPGPKWLGSQLLWSAHPGNNHSELHGSNSDINLSQAQQPTTGMSQTRLSHKAETISADGTPRP